MSVTSFDKDFDALTLTLIADFAAPIDRVWELFADPRKLERWWGPPGFPATFGDHDLSAGGMVRYYMTSPQGERMHGYWRVLAAEPPTSLEFSDGFADDTGAPNAELPATITRIVLDAAADGTRMELVSRFESREQMDQMMEIGLGEGLQLAVNQMDDLLAA